MSYCQAILPKAGLGNRLFPWARCLIFSRVNNIPMLSTFWPQFKIGELFRGESNFRFYTDLFKNNKKDITGLKKIWAKIALPKMPEPKELTQATCRKETLYVFKGCSDCFRRLNEWDELIRGELRAITKKKWLSNNNNCDEVIGMHIRMGDFIKIGLKTPLSWFAESLQAIRKAVGSPVKAEVFSDGTEKELKPLLDFDNVCLIRGKSAISDLWALSRAKVLIASGGSSFSAWAVFLEQMPVISRPGHSLEWFGVKSKKKYYIGEFNPNHPNDSFLAQCRLSFKISHGN